MDVCVFCRIIAGREMANVIYRDERTVAFLDIRPIHPGHLLVAPLRHEASVSDLDDAKSAALIAIGKRLGRMPTLSNAFCQPEYSVQA